MEVVLLLLLVLCMFTWMGVAMAGLWACFSKAGRPGWAVLVPFYNLFVLIDVARKPWWWFFLLFVPFGIIVIYIEFAKSFGKEIGYGVGLALLPFVFLPLLGFGDAEYQG